MEYLTDPMYVFKKIGKKWNYVMKKLPDTGDNELRYGIKNPQYAKFRANKLQVILILDMLDPYHTIQTLKHNFGSKYAIYQVGK